MGELTFAQPMPQTDEEYQAAIEQMLAEARRLSERAEQDQNDDDLGSRRQQGGNLGQ